MFVDQGFVKLSFIFVIDYAIWSFLLAVLFNSICDEFVYWTVMYVVFVVVFMC